MTASIIQMNLTALKQYRSTLVDFNRQKKGQLAAIAERIAVAESERSFINLCGGIVDFQVELVDQLIAKREADAAAGSAAE